jgi:hypothetical protein
LGLYFVKVLEKLLAKLLFSDELCGFMRVSDYKNSEKFFGKESTSVARFRLKDIVKIRKEIDLFKRSALNDVQASTKKESKPSGGKIMDSLKCGFFVGAVVAGFGLIPALQPLLILAPLAGGIAFFLNYLITRN